MSRVFIFLFGVVLLAIMALALLWLVGQVVIGTGILLISISKVFFHLLWFFVIGGFLGSLLFFITSAWRPVRTTGNTAPVTPSSASSVSTKTYTKIPTKASKPKVSKPKSSEPKSSDTEKTETTTTKKL